MTHYFSLKDIVYSEGLREEPDVRAFLFYKGKLVGLYYDLSIGRMVPQITIEDDSNKSFKEFFGAFKKTYGEIEREENGEKIKEPVSFANVVKVLLNLHAIAKKAYTWNRGDKGKVVLVNVDKNFEVSTYITPFYLTSDAITEKSILDTKKCVADVYHIKEDDIYAYDRKTRSLNVLSGKDLSLFDEMFLKNKTSKRKKSTKA